MIREMATTPREITLTWKKSPRGRFLSGKPPVRRQANWPALTGAFLKGISFWEIFFFTLTVAPIFKVQQLGRQLLVYRSCLPLQNGSKMCPVYPLSLRHLLHDAASIIYLVSRYWHSNMTNQVDVVIEMTCQILIHTQSCPFSILDEFTL